MTTRSEREKAQKLNEQHQVILSKLLKEDDNKFCADCEAKGPRWASWNLGVFMCIRCAGIHRNLGVHISRVKSVNLDQWTPEQIQSMVDMGNGRARRLYEAHLPENFMRPQSDQSAEVLIRDKYDRKKYYDKEAAVAQQKAADATSTSTSNQTDRNKQEECRASPKKEASVDLLGLESPESDGKSSSAAAITGQEVDIFGPLVSNTLPAQAQSGSSSASQQDPSTSSSSSSSTSTATNTRAEEKKLLSKDSILSLYASSSVGSPSQSQQPQPAAGQGVFMGQSAMQFGPGVGGPVPTSTMMGGGAIMTGMTLPNGSYSGQEQGQWSVTQVTQQMSSVGVSGTGSAPAPGWTAAPAPPSSGQTLSTQLWK